MVLNGINQPLILEQIELPPLKHNEVLIKIKACGLCRTDLHILDNDLVAPNYPIVLGHEIIGEIIDLDKSVNDYKIGDRVGVPWLANTCKQCKFCLHNQENLCDEIQFTGYTIDGGFASHTIANADYIVKLPDNYTDIELAPFMCAGLIGYRALSFLTPGSKNIGLYGFGAAAHIATQVLLYQQKNVYAFTRPGDTIKQNFAKSLGAIDAYDSNYTDGLKLDAAIIFAPDGKLVINALKVLNKGGTVILAGIHMSDIPSFAYDLIWQEKSIKTVANLTNHDKTIFFNFIKRNRIIAQTTTYNIKDLNQAVLDMRAGKIPGAIVITM